MRLSFSLLILTFVLACINAATTNLNAGYSNPVTSAPLLSNGAAVDEVVVESSLYIKPKPQQKPIRRRVRRAIRATLYNAHLADLENKRVKRMPQYFGFQQQQPFYSQSQAASNSAANSNYYNPYGGFGAAAANAQAQAFNAQGPAGGFGASSSGTVTQAQNANKFGLQNTAGASMSQAYTLPNGQTINFALSNNFANRPNGNNADSRGGAVSVSRG